MSAILGALCATLLAASPAPAAKAADPKAAEPGKSAEPAPPAAQPAAKPADGAAKPADAKPAEAKKDDKKPEAGKPGEAKKDEKDEEPPAPAKPEWFDEALALHYAGKAREAAPKFYAYIHGSPRTADNYEWAEFFMADDLARLGFTHAAIVYWSEVTKSRTRTELLPEALAALEKLTNQVPYDAELVEREVLYGTDFGYIPPAAFDYVHFHKGLIAQRDGNLRWATQHFSKLHAGTPYFARAKLVRAVEKMTRENDTDGALADFEALSTDKTAPRDVRNEARIGAARLYFERGEYDKTHQLYDGVELPDLDPGRGEIYLEKAWTYYRRGEASLAMGVLLALDAPSFRELFLPEKYILASLIYKERCHYLPAKRAARGFTRRYKQALGLVHERGNLKDDVRLVRAALEQDAAVRRAGDFVELLGRERDLVDQYTSRFESSGLTRKLRGMYDRALAEATRQRESMLRRALISAADRLLRDEEQVRLLDYEIGLDLYKRVKKGSLGQRIPVNDPIVGDADVVYGFDGEYWNDELKDYRLFLPTRCAAVEADK
jgi:tetratricopeptide (TPR) repeat protein